MKRAILPALMIALLCACSSPEKLEEDFNSWRSEIETVSLTAEVTISKDAQAAEYELQCEYSPENTRVEILWPESLKGITASKNGEETQLEYDNLILSLGEIEGISPVNAVPALLDTIRSGYVEQCYSEKNDDGQLMAVQFAPENDITIHLWLDENKIPQRADFESDTAAGIKLAITDWNIG